ncbi:sigma-54-dependent Fis family transcriptional regulator [Alishewanella longhuensis]|uniref:Sigma-54-dependent Fis family transcriptional regulator n=1 Tax=Alishewanella longhuensis TaxID=1091037 RepID=A0ABQ3KZN3_9ALTE|nr:sigma-54 dependent transcriptional regulator [Alishewanella longhuensis]GHG69452.1 sigma-54-dependent Fis family transcriptional regulator [Alishewanella longhuensis]
MSDIRILIVEDDAGLREALTDTLLLANYLVSAAASAEEALLLLKKQRVQLVISDVQMGSVSGLTLLKTLREQHPALPVLMMTAYANVQDAVEAIRLGAIDYLSKPFSPEVLVTTVSRYVVPEEGPKFVPIAEAAESKALLVLAARVAQSDASVMILGPSGSGKEVLARYIHLQSSRASASFVAINCAAIPDNMLESTLFGYEKGAFTGAIAACPGKFEQAQGGTLLLDEISEMPLNLQAKLLRVLQEREVERLGGRKTIKLDVRILATSNRDLRQAVTAGIFREDLYYRLNVFPLRWPALAERSADIVPLAQHLLQRHCVQQQRGVVRLSAAAAARLSLHSWPGNVRELDNVIQRALILQPGNEIGLDDILVEAEPLPVTGNIVTGRVAAELTLTADAAAQGTTDFKAEIHEQEHKLILATMQACAFKRKDVAQKLGISDRTLRYKLARMRESGIEMPA